METTEKIVEAYVRYVKGWATIPNIRCDGQQEIDLLAIDPKSGDRYHIETSISTSQGFSKLTAKPFDLQLKKQRGHQATMRRTLGYFVQQKFGKNPNGEGSETVAKKLLEFGFEPQGHKKIIVTWGWTEDAESQAQDADVTLWDFRTIMQEIAHEIRDKSSYFSDDTLRTLNLFVRAMPADSRNRMTEDVPDALLKDPSEHRFPFWVYQNRPNQRARLHRSTCSYCNDGKGTQNSPNSPNGKWDGFTSEEEARRHLLSTAYENAKLCNACMEIQS